jgi:hypothetical protein
MGKPTDKSASVSGALDSVSEELFGTSRTEAITKDTCLFCKGDASEFRNDLSRREFNISGICQVCQDEVFGDD